MQLQITMDVDNASFEDDPHGELINVMAPVTYAVATAISESRASMGSIKDRNGNRIGGWVLSQGEE